MKSFPKNPEKFPKAAIVGLGSVSPMHIKSLEALGIPIVAVCDNCAEKVFSISKKMGCASYVSYEKMLEAGGFDVLHICLPHHLHAPVAVAAFGRGVHVLTEKPMATTVADAEKMISAAEDSEKILGVVFQNRYSPGAVLIKNTLAGGELGKVKSGWMRVTWHRSDDYYASSDWRGKLLTEGGGVAINQSIHSFDLLNYFLGNPTEVDASIANRAHPAIEVEDVAEGLITYGEATVSFFVNTFHPYDAPAGLELICEHGKAALIGEDAVISWNDGRVKTAGADTETQKQFGMKSYWGVSHVKQIGDFYESLKTGSIVKIGGKEGLLTQRLISGIYQSAKEETRVIF